MKDFGCYMTAATNGSYYRYAAKNERRTAWRVRGRGWFVMQERAGQKRVRRYRAGPVPRQVAVDFATSFWKSWTDVLGAARRVRLVRSRLASRAASKPD